MHDLDALQVSSLLVALLRKVQAWCYASIQVEMRFNLCFGTGNVFKPTMSGSMSQAGQMAKGTEAEDEETGAAMAFVKKWHQPSGPLHIREHQKRGEDPTRLPPSDAALTIAPTSSKQQQNGELQLPPRRHIANWLWPPPHLLSRLADPYDVLPHATVSAEISKREKDIQDNEIKPSEGTSSSSTPATSRLMNATSSTAGRATSTSARSSPRMAKVPLPHTESSSAQAAAAELSLTNGQGHASYGIGALPVLHPTMRLRFEYDPLLPAPPAPSKQAARNAAPSASTHIQAGYAASSRPSTPARTSSPRPSATHASVRVRDKTLVATSDQQRISGLSAPPTPGSSRPQTPVKQTNLRAGDASVPPKPHAATSPSPNTISEPWAPATNSLSASRASSPRQRASKSSGEVEDGKPGVDAVAPFAAGSKDTLLRSAPSQKEPGDATMGLVGLGLDSGQVASTHESDFTVARAQAASQNPRASDMDTSKTLRSGASNQVMTPHADDDPISKDVFGPISSGQSGRAAPDTYHERSALPEVRSPSGAHATLHPDRLRTNTVEMHSEGRPYDELPREEPIASGVDADSQFNAENATPRPGRMGYFADRACESGSEAGSANHREAQAARHQEEQKSGAPFVVGDEHSASFGQPNFKDSLARQPEIEEGRMSIADNAHRRAQGGDVGPATPNAREVHSLERDRRSVEEHQRLEGPVLREEDHRDGIAQQDENGGDAAGEEAEVEGTEQAEQVEEEEEEEEEEEDEDEEERYSEEEEEEEEDSGSDRALEALDLEGW